MGADMLNLAKDGGPIFVGVVITLLVLDRVVKWVKVVQYRPGGKKDRRDNGGATPSIHVQLETQSKALSDQADTLGEHSEILNRIAGAGERQVEILGKIEESSKSQELSLAVLTDRFPRP